MNTLDGTTIVNNSFVTLAVDEPGVLLLFLSALGWVALLNSRHTKRLSLLCLSNEYRSPGPA